MQEKTNEQIYQELKGDSGRSTVNQYARRFRELFGISMRMRDEQMKTIKKLALQDRHNCRIYLYAEKEGIKKDTAARYAWKVRKGSKEAGQRYTESFNEE